MKLYSNDMKYDLTFNVISNERPAAGFALLRLQELKKVRASVLFLSEQMLLVLASSLVGGLVMLLTEPAFSTAAAVNGVILIAYLIGAAQG